MKKIHIVTTGEIFGANGVSVFIRNLAYNFSSDKIKIESISGVSSGKVVSWGLQDYKNGHDNYYGDDLVVVKTSKIKKDIKEKLKNIVFNSKILSFIFFLKFCLQSIIINFCYRNKNLDNHDIIFYQDFISASCSSLLKPEVKKVLILHSSEDAVSQLFIAIPGLDSTVGRLFIDMLLNHSISNCEAVVTLGDSFKDKLSKINPDKKIVCIYNGTPLVDSRAINTNRSKSDKIRICCVGSIIARKGQDLLVSSLTKLFNEGYVNFECSFFGAGDKYFTDGLINETHNLRDNFLFRGVVDSPLSNEDFDLFILPSRNEGLPLAIIEASSVALPIIATNVGSISEAFGDSIYLIEPNLDSLYCAIKEFMSDERLFQYYADLAFEKFEQELSFECMEKKYISLFEGL